MTTRAEWLTSTIRRVTANNPSPLTGKGTNSYLLGQGGGLALIDPGPDLAAHAEAILAALRQGEEISHIFVTHAHRDHSDLAPRMAQLTGAAVYAFGPVTKTEPAFATLLAGLGETPDEAGIDAGFAPHHRVAEGETIAAASWSLRAWHTPGHLGDHLCFAAGDILFSGDHVMGWSTTVVSPPGGHMGDYMASLHRLGAEKWSLALPGHGPEIIAPTQRIAELITHRRARETAILAVLRTGPASLDQITALVYRDLAAYLFPAAKRNVLSHLLDLMNRNAVRSQSAVTPTAIFEICP